MVTCHHLSNEDENGLTIGGAVAASPTEKSRLGIWRTYTDLKKKKKAQSNNSLTFTHILASTRSTACIKFSPWSDGSAACTGFPGWQRSHSDVPALFQRRLMRRSHALRCSRKRKGFRLRPRTLLLLIFHVSLSLVFIGTFHFDSHRAPRWCNPIPAHWCMQCFKAVLWKLYVSLGARHASVMYACLENQRRILASLWINVHSVKKINGINSMNSPQRCRSSLRRSISNRTVFVLKK